MRHADKFMEIEKKFLIKELPSDLESYPHYEIEQAYLNRSPVLRIRKKGDAYIFTYKGEGMLAREEIEARLDVEAYAHLLEKADGKIITKTRYEIPYEKYLIELDVFAGHMAPLVMAEVEFASLDEADDFVPPAWFGEEVTLDARYHNVNMALGMEEV